MTSQQAGSLARAPATRHPRPGSSARRAHYSSLLAQAAAATYSQPPRSLHVHHARLVSNTCGGQYMHRRAIRPDLSRTREPQGPLLKKPTVVRLPLAGFFFFLQWLGNVRLLVSSRPVPWQARSPKPAL